MKYRKIIKGMTPEETIFALAKGNPVGFACVVQQLSFADALTRCMAREGVLREDLRTKSGLTRKEIAALLGDFYADIPIKNMVAAASALDMETHVLTRATAEEPKEQSR